MLFTQQEKYTKTVWKKKSTVFTCPHKILLKLLKNLWDGETSRKFPPSSFRIYDTHKNHTKLQKKKICQLRYYYAKAWVIAHVVPYSFICMNVWIKSKKLKKQYWLGDHNLVDPLLIHSDYRFGTCMNEVRSCDYNNW